jgi:hypothetical protein
MGQTQIATKEGMAEVGKFFASEAATAPKVLALLDTSCCAGASETYANNDSNFATQAGVTMCTSTEMLSTQTTNADDTTQIAHTWTITDAAGGTYKGFVSCNTDCDVMYAICCFAADVVMAQNDSIQCIMNIQFICT